MGRRRGWGRCGLGAGRDETMRLMGESVGRPGQVTGLGRDARAGREAIERLAATGTSRYRFIEADMESTSEIGGELFDLTFAPPPLMFTRDPVAVLRKMYSRPKPGGYVAGQGLHAHPIHLYPQLD